MLRKQAAAAAAAGQDGGAAEAARRSTRSTAGKLAGKNWDAPVSGGSSAANSSGAGAAGAADAVSDSAAIGQVRACEKQSGSGMVCMSCKGS